jgi:4-alpha-glucanotransferase
LDIFLMAGYFPRASGILLHITSLPGPYGVGDIGPAARDFADKLYAAGQTYWQILPIGPTGFADSPYQCLSSFAGNTNLISLNDLLTSGWLTQGDLADKPPFDVAWVDYGSVIPWHDAMLDLAHDNFLDQANPAYIAEFQGWCKQNAGWLDDFSLFISLKAAYGGKPWVEWSRGDAFRDPVALATARLKLADRIESHRFRQWLFFRQWTALKRYVNDQHIRIIGDIPIFIGHDSCDVWSNRDLFELDENGYPNAIAGVPPDSFSATGQRWGNPLYMWDRHRATNYAWWIKRIDAALTLVDVIRIDHFRGFDRYWSIPANEPTAERGTWNVGPGRAFFDALGPTRIARIIAEDLGDDLGHAIVLRDELKLPGMIVLQFAFSGTAAERTRFKPGTPGENFIIYTGTHDNNTALGWWQREATPAQQQALMQYVQAYHIQEPNWAMIRLGMDYAGHTFIVPLQDVLGLDASARMNTPSVPGGNWRWRCTDHDLMNADWQRLRLISEQTGRLVIPASSVPLTSETRDKLD